MRVKWIALAWVWAAVSSLQAADYPPLVPPREAPTGAGYQRTMRLLAQSTRQKRNQVRILYYGQSIVGQRWSEQVDAYLREKYPHAELITENRAIGGFASQLLARTTHYDVMPFYPDLVVFHVYGAHDKYEQIIREIRQRTTAEIIMQSDHATAWPEPKASGNFWQTQKQWDDKMNYFLLPGIAKKYGCAFQPQRWEWADYLKAHQLEPEDLLSDNVHLNAHGKWLMGELLKRYLVHKPETPVGEASGSITTYEVGKDVKWQGGRLTLEFEGNRVVALAGSGQKGTAQVLIDGKSPAEFASCYSITRPSAAHGAWFPAVKRVTWNAVPQLETWTVTCSNFNDKQDDFRFEVVGSVTGPDGQGRAKEKFVSKSGRVIIEPQDWSFDYAKRVSNKPAPDGTAVTWTVIPLFTETYAPEPAADPAREYPTVLASDLPNAKHRLELAARDGTPPPIRFLRVYRPPLR